MKIRRLHSDFRRNLRNLIQGYVEHCQVSDHLTGRIDFPVYYHGFKFGAPVFTHRIPDSTGHERPVVGIIGWNTPSSQAPAQVLLQFIEILVQHPLLADEAILRMLPVANPIALELEGEAPDREDYPLLGHVAERFKESAVDGWIEIHTGNTDQFVLEGEVNRHLRQAIETVNETAPERPGRMVTATPALSRLSPLPDGERWQLRVTLPTTWSGSESIHTVALYLARLTHTYFRGIRKSQRREESEEGAN